MIKYYRKGWRDKQGGAVSLGLEVGKTLEVKDDSIRTDGVDNEAWVVDDEILNIPLVIPLREDPKNCCYGKA